MFFENDDFSLFKGAPPENAHFQMPTPPLIFHLGKKFEFLFIV